MRVMGRGLVGPLVALAALLLPAVPALAHSDLKSSDPADGATLASAPASVSFTFNEQLLAQGNAIVLTDLATGSRLEAGPVEVDGDTVSVGWPEQAATGQYRAAYRVVSADGHPIDGSITFTVASPGGSASASPGATPPATAAATATPSSASSAGTPSPVGTQSTASGADGSGSGVLAWVLGLGAVVVVGAGAGAWFMRRSR